MKRLIAYSSVSHLGFCMLGLFALTNLGIEGGILQMVNHGLSTGGLFAVIGMLYERYHTREIAKLGGLARRVPILAFFFLLFTFSSIGLPGMNGFAGELLVLVGMFTRAWTDAPQGWETAYKVMAVASVFGVVLGAWYMLYLVQRVFFGPLREGDHVHAPPAGHVHGHDAHGDSGQAGHGHAGHGHGHGASGHDDGTVRDASSREIAALVPLVVFIFWIGLHPEFFLERMRPALEPLARSAVQALDERAAPGPAALVQDRGAAVGELTRVD
jgi:NADH-quinone oxidoreductase subunit M